PAAGASVLDASGYVVARRQATVSAKITGKLIDVPVEEGQRVDQDQVIAQLDDSNTKATLEQAAAEFSQAEASVTAAKVALEDREPIYRRSEILAAKGTVSVDAFDNTKMNYHTAQNNLLRAQRAAAVAEASLHIAERNQDDTVVKAP